MPCAHSLFCTISICRFSKIRSVILIKWRIFIRREAKTNVFSRDFVGKRWFFVSIGVSSYVEIRKPMFQPGFCGKTMVLRIDWRIFIRRDAKTDVFSRDFVGKRWFFVSIGVSSYVEMRKPMFRAGILWENDGSSYR